MFPAVDFSRFFDELGAGIYAVDFLAFVEEVRCEFSVSTADI